MATKAELEAEVKNLKRQLEESKANARAVRDTGPEKTEAPEGAGATPGDDLSELVKALKDGEIDASQVVDKIEQTLKQNPIVAGLIIFALGYMIGRAR